MHHFIDRRRNPSGKSLSNRQRLMRRARHYIKQTVDKSVANRSIRDTKDVSHSEHEIVTIPVKGISEPRFVHSSAGGLRHKVFPGNKDFVTGDRLPRPKSNVGGAGSKASKDGEGEDEFSFGLTRNEYLDILFEGLELPDLSKKKMGKQETISLRRGGITTSGSPSNINLVRTMRHSLGRRIALQRPSTAEIQRLEAQIERLVHIKNPPADISDELKDLRQCLEKIKRRRSVIGFIDPVDLRFNTFRPETRPNYKAVIFCLMDVSGSMQEREKDLAKRFFMLVHLFIESVYAETEIVFIRHTQTAEDVDEETFFYDQQTGGTIVSSALEKMRDIIADRYSPDEWNIYGAQASDGENYSQDSAKCADLLSKVLLPVCQYYAYVEIIPEREKKLLATADAGGELWQAYRRVRQSWPRFDIERVANRNHIYPLFRTLFSPKLTGSGV